MVYRVFGYLEGGSAGNLRVNRRFRTYKGALRAFEAFGPFAYSLSFVRLDGKPLERP